MLFFKNMHIFKQVTQNWPAAMIYGPMQRWKKYYIYVLKYR